MAYLDELCSRCGSKKVESKTWKETIETYSGKSVLEISQIICTNKECQKAFEEEQKVAMAKREEMMQEKQKREELRKANIHKPRKA